MNDTNRFCACISGTGMYVPEKVLTNAELEKRIDTSDEWILTRTGISERRIASKDESSSVLGAHAARAALADAGLSPSDVDVIIVCTSTPDVLFPATACFVQREIGAKNAAAYDVSAVCSGFVYGLSIAEQYIKSGRYRHVLLIGAEVNSRIVDWEDRSTCILFGDGAGAVVLSREEADRPRGVLSTHIYSDGTLSDLIRVPGGIGRDGFSGGAIDPRQYCIHMMGNQTFKVAVKRMADVSQEALAFNGLSTEDVSLMVPHQANQRIIDAVGERLGVPGDKVYVNINKYGNTSAASIPIALCEAREAGRVHPEDVLLLGVVGAGLTWGAAVIRW
jgi:3-oxoacyl-[acyl-carrier-protein] synthase-3